MTNKDGKREDIICMLQLRTGIAQVGGEVSGLRTMEYVSRAGGAQGTAIGATGACRGGGQSEANAATRGGGRRRTAHRPERC